MFRRCQREVVYAEKSYELGEERANSKERRGTEVLAAQYLIEW